MKAAQPSFFDEGPEIRPQGQSLTHPAPSEPLSIDGRGEAEQEAAGASVEARTVGGAPCRTGQVTPAHLIESLSEVGHGLPANDGHGPEAEPSQRRSRAEASQRQPVKRGTVVADPGQWREVPQALFASWSRPRQLDYCARRDERAAIDALDGEAAFYLERAAAYRAEMRA